MKSMAFVPSLLLAAGLTCCSTAMVNSDFDHDFDFAGRQAYAWADMPQRADSNYYAQNSLVEKRLQTAVELVLAGKGFYKHTSSAGAAEFLIAYQVGFDDKLFVISSRHWAYYGFGFKPSGPYLREYKEVTLILDFLNPETGELIWHGWYIGAVEDTYMQEGKVVEAVERILEKFPPEQQADRAPVPIALNQ